MYRSQRGGSGGTGGGSGIITPPGQEDKEKKPWGEDYVDWNNQDSIRKFVKKAQEGNIEGASGRLFKRCRFCSTWTTWSYACRCISNIQTICLDTLKNMQTAQEIARAKWI